MNRISLYSILTAIFSVLILSEADSNSIGSSDSKERQLVFSDLNRAKKELNNNLNKRIKRSARTKFKILFADSIFSYDFNEIIFNELDSYAITEYSTRLAENLPTESFICFILLKENLKIILNGDTDSNFYLEQVNFGSGANTPLFNLFSIKLVKELDRELKDTYDLSIQIIYEKYLTEKLTNLIIHVDDCNDNRPKFNKISYKFESFENNPINSCIGSIYASDPDLGINGTIKYSLIPDTLTAYPNELDTLFKLNESIFFVNELTGELCVKERLDREKFSKYQMKAVAKDSGVVELLSDPIHIEVTVLDLNDNPPEFYHETKPRPQFYLKENSQPGQFIAWLKAFDLDANENSKIDYELQIIEPKRSRQKYEDLFEITSDGVLKSKQKFKIDETNLNKSVDSEFILLNRKNNFLVKIIAKDRGLSSLRSECFINVKIFQETFIRHMKFSPNPNKSIYLLDKSSPVTYERSFLKLDTVNYRDHLDNQTQIQNENLIYSSRLVFQIKPKYAFNKLNGFEYGQNCDQTDLITYFYVSKNGELFLSNTFKDQQEKINEINICLINFQIIYLNNNSINVIESNEIAVVLHSNFSENFETFSTAVNHRIDSIRKKSTELQIESYNEYLQVNSMSGKSDDRKKSMYVYIYTTMFLIVASLISVATVVVLVLFKVLKSKICTHQNNDANNCNSKVTKSDLDKITKLFSNAVYAESFASPCNSSETSETNSSIVTCSLIAEKLKNEEFQGLSFVSNDFENEIKNTNLHRNEIKSAQISSSISQSSRESNNLDKNIHKQNRKFKIVFEKSKNSSRHNQKVI